MTNETSPDMDDQGYSGLLFCMLSSGVDNKFIIVYISRGCLLIRLPDVALPAENCTDTEPEITAE